MGNIQKHIWYFTILVLYVLFQFTDVTVFKSLGHVMLSINFGLLFVVFGVLLFLSTEDVKKFHVKLAQEFSFFNLTMSIVIMTLLIYFGNLILAGVLFILMVLTTIFYNRGIDIIQNESTK